MAYRRRTAVGSVVALVSALLSMVLLTLVAWQLSMQKMQGRLDTLADLLIKREEQIIAQSRDALTQLMASSLTPCSRAHIRQMRQLTVGTPALGEIGYVEHSRVICSSWGDGAYELSQSDMDAQTLLGLVVYRSTMPAFSGGEPAVAMAYGPYRALISLNHFVDVVVEPGMQLGLATRDGKLIASFGADDPALMERILSSGGTHPAPGYVYELSRTNDWVAVAVHPSDGWLQYLREEYPNLLPFLIMVGVFVFLWTLAIWLKRPSLLAELRLAIRSKRLEVHYQPMLNARTGTCVGAEALMRWNQGGDDDGWMRPDLFIPIAEDSRLIEPMNDRLLHMVADEMGELLKENPDLHISLNLDAESVSTGKALALLDDTLIAAGVAPGQIWLEVTERCFMDIESARSTLRQARDRGYVVAIDDFGTGYSSLQYLQSLPVDVLKVDKSFITAIGTGAVSSHVIYHIIEMGKSLNLTIVVEGVETQAQADYLQQRDVVLMQGWLYAKAMPAKEFKDFVYWNRNLRPSA